MVYDDGETRGGRTSASGGKIKPGTMRSIIKQAGMSVDEFLDLL